jgi:RNA polymerase sigma-70 factor (ECF subfamily)
MPAPDEQLLIEQAKEGNRSAFSSLVELHMKHAYNLAYRFVNDHSDAEDIAQEAFVRAFRGIESFKGNSKFGTWIYRIVVNLSLNHIKRKNRNGERELSISDSGEEEMTTHTDTLYRVDTRMHVERALHRLPTIQRMVVILRHVEGLSTKEVSEILNCSEGTVKTHLHRALRKMRTMLDYLRNEAA